VGNFKANNLALFFLNAPSSGFIDQILLISALTGA
jgi:hypothetical protein